MGLKWVGLLGFKLAPSAMGHGLTRPIGPNYLISACPEIQVIFVGPYLNELCSGRLSPFDTSRLGWVRLCVVEMGWEGCASGFFKFFFNCAILSFHIIKTI